MDGTVKYKILLACWHVLQVMACAAGDGMAIKNPYKFFCQ